MLQESGQNLIASVMKGLALHPVNGRVYAKVPTSPATSELSSSHSPFWLSSELATQQKFYKHSKIIGARYYNSKNVYDVTEFKSPRDSEGHGTHTSSTAAGREVAGASYFGLADGTARGGLPGARIAMYKVCWSTGLSSADVLAAFDDAIADGVDIISVSIGFGGLLPYFEDPIAIGSFHAMKNGILTTCSAGNSGPSPSTIANYAPWILTVAASTIDRKFVAQVVLGNGQVYTSFSVGSYFIPKQSSLLAILC